MKWRRKHVSGGLNNVGLLVWASRLASRRASRAGRRKFEKRGLCVELVESRELLATLVGHWKLDETTGSIAADSSGSGNNGTMTWGPAPSTGRVNGALAFD